ncbi:jg16963 [Pararge aegeria aegeria]|uniref:Jg16963 protein n=1 Tax=Pararge aegeria aegeria TaxID=348720 RepID=A0A8S4RKZ3_9NEOP|nr:jg16963 [Pararge aegeria aegeria]
MVGAPDVVKPSEKVEAYSPHLNGNLIFTISDTEKHSCSSQNHFPVLGIEPTALDSESRAAAHCDDMI